MDDLELLKEDWNKDSYDFVTYSEQDIYEMFKKKSGSIAKKLFLIGLAEISLWGVFDYFYGFTFPVIKYLQFILFTLLTIWSYYRINNAVSSKKLIQSIIELRYILLLFVSVTLGLILFETFYYYEENTINFLKGFIEGYSRDEVKITKEETIKRGYLKIGYFVFFSILILFFLFLYWVYNFFYGDLIRDLKYNFKELSKIEHSDNTP
ncbi:MAG: hypothetical protein KBA33_03485 [Cloacibacterium sp.]|nr:hypothetical protein [Cloacibacterium sp.]